MYKKCFHEKVKVYFDGRLADCRGDKNVMTSSLSVVENGLVWSEHDEIVRRKSGRQPTSIPDQKEAKVLLASLENMKKYVLFETERERERERERDGHE